MKKETLKSYEDLPLMLSVPEMAAALGISRAGAYALARSEGFPALRIGNRTVIPKDRLQKRGNQNISTNRAYITSCSSTLRKPWETERCFPGLPYSC